MTPEPKLLPMGEWAERFALHWLNELREPGGMPDLLDWAYELYGMQGHLRPEDVAQAEWQAVRKV